MATGRAIADWRSPAPYAALARCDRRAFAWEWLRRSADYRQAVATRNDGDAARFGLCRLEPTELGVPAARPVWRHDADPAVLRAAAMPAGAARDAIDAVGLVGIGNCVADAAGEHWLWSDGQRSIRLDIVEGTLRGGTVALDFQITGGLGIWPQALALPRLIGLARTGRIIRKLFESERRAPRWALVLRVHDALVDGATQRDIARALLGLGSGERWRIEAPSARRQVQRLVSAAQMQARADPRSWLALGVSS